MSTALSTATQEKDVSFLPFGAAPGDEIRLSVAIIKQFVSVKTRSGAVCDDAQAMKFLMLCKARKLNPFEGDAFLIGFDGKDGPQFSLVTSHQAFLKRAEVHPEFDGLLSGVLVRDSNGNLLELEGDFHTSDQILVGAWAKVFFKTRKYPMFKKLKLETFKKPFGVWANDPAGMIVKCAESDALRSSFPTLCGGMMLQEEAEAQIERATVVHSTRSSLVPTPEPRQISAPPTPQPKREEPKRPEVTAEPPRPKREPAEKAAVNTPTPAAAVAPNPPFVASTVQKSDEEEATGTVVEPQGEGDPFADEGSPAVMTAGKTDEVQPLTPPKNVEECAQLIRQSLTAAGLTEDQLMTWAKGTQPPLANSRQTQITNLAGSKLLHICEQWPAIIADLKAGF